MHKAELLSVDEHRPIRHQATSVQNIDWIEVANALGRPVSVLFDYDQAIAPATNTVPSEVRNSIYQAREIGAIARFGIASDNPLAGTLSGMRRHSDYIFGPYIKGARLITKASPLFYQRILDVLDADPSDLLMVGHDPLRDILSAQSVGISTIQVPPLGTLYQGLVAHRGRRLAQSARRLTGSTPAAA